MLNRVEFQTGVSDVTTHVLRLLRKAYAQGARVAVTGPGAWLRELDAALWTSERGDFVPHAMLVEGSDASEHVEVMARTPLWLVHDARDVVHAPSPIDVLITVGPDVPEGVMHFARVIEVVGRDTPSRSAAHKRWRAYQARGLTIDHRPMDQGQTGSDGAKPLALHDAAHNAAHDAADNATNPDLATKASHS